ncbi:hypothetical protein ZIOFF_050948 [Zingiber officinale]|uniref:Uncharacterized protein n=1 Tax=Zingiber officinale TaxID=94328 RepID=A0A8J5FHX5_ZINOF|nr:hypothetical protein ZIOFF_050948 [Zingiber officinale]
MRPGMPLMASASLQRALESPCSSGISATKTKLIHDQLLLCGLGRCRGCAYEAFWMFLLVRVKLIAVGVGTPDKACMLAERCFNFAHGFLHLHFQFTVAIYGLSLRGLGKEGRTFFNPASMGVDQEGSKNYTITATPGNSSSVLQQGGMFVFKGKHLLYGRKDEGTGDHAPLDEIFDICNNATIA